MQDSGLPSNDVPYVASMEEQTPSHQYTAAGTYTVTLTATNSVGSNTLTKTRYITVNAAPALVKASFTAIPVSGQPPLMTYFTDTSTGKPTVWEWEFGDGSVETIQHPTHSYATAGIYTVTLTVTNANEGNKVVKKNYIRCRRVRSESNFLFFIQI